MNKRLLLALAVGLVVGIVVYTNIGQEADQASLSEKKEAAFEQSQATTSDTSVAALQSDLNSTVILEEDFSDLE